MEQDEIIIIDGPLLARAFRRQLRGWLWKGSLLFLALLGAALLLVPRSYTASVSVAMQQPTAPGGLAGLLGGGGSGNKHYMGVLKSRELASQVEKHVKLSQVYGAKMLPTEAAAAGLLAKGVKPEDNPDGLLYISVTLPGSPAISLTHAPPKARVEDAAARAANAYAAALKNYFINSDNDQGVALLRGADAQVRQAKADYYQALGRLRDFGQAMARANPRSTGAVPRSGTSTSAASGVTPGADSDATAASSGLEALYAQYNQVETDLHAAQAVRLTRENKTAEQLRNLSRLPTDDPQLNDARSRVERDRVSLETASRLYGPENPAVIRAQAQLDSDQRQLDQQVQGVRDRLTTVDSSSEQQISGLYAKQAILLDKIGKAERRLGVSRSLSFEQNRLQAELGFQADILRETLTQAQSIKINNASAQSRMSVIDSALPPGAGEPGTTRLALYCLVPVLLAFLLAVVRDYLGGLRAPRGGDKADGALPPATANGSGARPLSETTDVPPLAKKR